MDIARTLYIIGLMLVILYLLTGTDDFIWDIVTVFRRRNFKNQRIDLKELNNITPKLLAFTIAAWHEENVLGDVIENLMISVQYPKSMYHVFLGVYPNDDATIKVAKDLSEKYPNVHMIINELPGPTSKAQNLNYVIRQIKGFEKKHGWKFASLTVHDSEDVVHPYELKMTNYLLENHDAIQFPVFPLIPMPRFKNFFKTITTNTYTDEFAENHFSTMVNRRNMGAFVPSAGTGFALSSATIDAFGEEDVLPRDSLTEDYRLSLTLYEKGISMYYALERVPRLIDEGKLKWDYVATRSRFPDTFKTAVKQKTRWILGITMQSFKFNDIFQTKGLSFIGRYSLYKDIKAKVGNLLVLVGYPVLIYFIISLFLPLLVIYPKYSLSWYLSWAVTLMMIQRQFFRSVAIYNVYGMKSVFFACLFPPLLPIRLVWGNIINLVATVRAYKQHLFGNKTSMKKEKNSEKKKIPWAKTDHAFLEKSVLKRYHRNIGDVLLERGLIEAEELQEALEKKGTTMLGNYLIENKLLTEEQLLMTLSNVQLVPYIEAPNLNDYDTQKYADYVGKRILRRFLAVPLLKTETGFVFGFSNNSPKGAKEKLEKLLAIEIEEVFVSHKILEAALDKIRCNGPSKKEEPNEDFQLVRSLYAQKKIDFEQYIVASNYRFRLGKSEIEILAQMGLYKEDLEGKV